MNSVTRAVVAHAILVTCSGTAAFASSLETAGVLTLLEEIRVPARVAGILSEVAVRPGMHIADDDLLAKQDDTEEQVVRDRARIDLSNAQRLASNDLKVRLARKSHDVAVAELQRAINASQRFSKSVSQSEIDRLELAAEQAELEVYQTQFDLGTAELAVDSHQAALRLAEHRLELRAIHTPTSGVVVEVLKQPGEWIEPGETVVRIVRMDRLRVEGFLPAEQANAKLLGHAAKVSVTLRAGETAVVDGRVTFVSPEVHPVNGMVRVWVEIENADSALRPGLQAIIKIER